MIKAIEKLNIGVEEEYQLINPKTRELTSYVTELLEDGALVSDNDVINGADIIVQLGLIADEKSLLLKENQTIEHLMIQYTD